MSDVSPSFPWDSVHVGVAEIGDDGTIRRANGAIQRAAARRLDGEPCHFLVPEDHLPTFKSLISEASDGWAKRTLPMFPVNGSPPRDHVAWIRRDGEHVVVITEPFGAEDRELTERLIRMNEELLRSQQLILENQKQLERAIREMRI